MGLQIGAFGKKTKLSASEVHNERISTEKGSQAADATSGLGSIHRAGLGRDKWPLGTGKTFQLHSTVALLLLTDTAFVKANCPVNILIFALGEIENCSIELNRPLFEGN